MHIYDILVSQTISLMKRMVSSHARVFPFPVVRDFCFDPCGVRMNKGGSVVAERWAAELWVAVEPHRVTLESLRSNFEKVPKHTCY